MEDVEQTTDESGKVRTRPSRWYTVQVASGCEKKVKANLEQRRQTLDVADDIVQIEIPQTPVKRMRKDGSHQNAEEKVFPGYVLLRIQQEWDDVSKEWGVPKDAWLVIKNTPHVINFVGAEQRRAYGRGRGHVKPMPLSRSEVERIFKQAQEQKPVVKVDMEAGDRITVLSGPFKDFEGEVIEVSPERSKLKALLSIFGRDTPVELEFNQVQKES
ncbi:MAG TPA: transcription termination/antitermination protein NusG [Candidatus Obscuribacterales bacterium]